jgi:hypothetical protein
MFPSQVVPEAPEGWKNLLETGRFDKKCRRSVVNPTEVLNGEGRWRAVTVVPFT